MIAARWFHGNKLIAQVGDGVTVGWATTKAAIMQHPYAKSLKLEVLYCKRQIDLGDVVRDGEERGRGERWI